MTTTEGHRNLNYELAAWLARDYEGRHCRVEIVCSYPGCSEPGEEEDADFHYTVELTCFYYEGGLPASSTGDHSSSTVTHAGMGSTLDEAIEQALAQMHAAEAGT